MFLHLTKHKLTTTSFCNAFAIEFSTNGARQGVRMYSIRHTHKLITTLIDNNTVNKL